MPEQKQTRSCYNCEHYSLCFLKKRIEKSLEGAWMICPRAGEGAPRVWTDIFDTLAQICIEFKERSSEGE